MEYSNDMKDVYKNIENYNPGKKRKILIVFDDMIGDMINNEKLLVVTELFIRGRNLNISIVFIIQSYFKVPKDVRLSSTHFFITRIPNERELQQIALDYSSDIDFNDFIKITKEILPSNQQQIIEQAKFTYSLLGKAFEKQIKTIEDQGKKQIDALAGLKPKEIKPKETKPY